ncbi:uncharacterized protein NECHADRAFT_84151 [Fusarium vanettenii 77-13-4]|uniref:Uncharacterized protein n=1 Tax=Fusarium vanettenii (strain ATCC MYA-4622 / CBS 123669 / FGSC 9596 / NRRL 45880 / 77-13-4) TaxID=660122 RepID=C7YZU8_FUSV7|nr:uncharacterized protein NECHADRAFT_84151 [Fusarium vanettenii 77-13-4]EEU42671.1 predicted protein [Fusarium vanettenii 77-13-4]
MSGILDVPGSSGVVPITLSMRGVNQQELYASLGFHGNRFIHPSSEICMSFTSLRDSRTGLQQVALIITLHLQPSKRSPPSLDLIATETKASVQIKQVHLTSSANGQGMNVDCL